MKDWPSNETSPTFDVQPNVLRFFAAFKQHLRDGKKSRMDQLMVSNSYRFNQPIELNSKKVAAQLLELAVFVELLSIILSSVRQSHVDGCWLAHLSTRTTDPGLRPKPSPAHH
jgi:hypothetical protein